MDDSFLQVLESHVSDYSANSKALKINAPKLDLNANHRHPCRSQGSTSIRQDAAQALSKFSSILENLLIAQSFAYVSKGLGEALQLPC